MAGECTLGQVSCSWGLWLDSAGSERQQRDNPAPAEEDARSPRNYFAFSFSVFPRTLFLGGVSLPFYFDFFPLVPLSVISLLPIAHFSVTSCCSLLSPVRYLAVTRDGFH